MRWTGTGFLELDRYVIYYSDHAIKYTPRVGFLVSRKVNPTLIDFENINEPLSAIRVQDQFRNIRVINILAPTKNTLEIDISYESEERTLEA